MAFRVLPFPPNEHPTTTKDPPGLSEVTEELAFFNQPMPAEEQLSPHLTSPVGPHMRGQPTKPQDSHRDARHWLGGPERRGNKWNGTYVQIDAQWPL